MVVTGARNWRWEEVDKDSIELSALTRHYELYNRTEVKSPLQYMYGHSPRFQTGNLTTDNMG